MQSTDLKYFTANRKGHPRERINTSVLRMHAEFLVGKPEGITCSFLLSLKGEDNIKWEESVVD